MTENMEVSVTQKLTRMKSTLGAKAPAIETIKPQDVEKESTIQTVKLQKPQDVGVIPAASAHSVAELVRPQIHRRSTGALNRSLSRQAEHQGVEAQVVQERCRRLCLTIFFRELAPPRSLGFTSSIGGEGKTFLALATTDVLVNDSHKPVILLECNWEHPCLHEHFGFAQTPGLAEWLRGECDKAAILHQVRQNLTVIPAGDGLRDAMRFLQLVRQRGLPELLECPDGLLVVDLPAIASTTYGLLAASLVEALVVVVHAGVTSDVHVAETCEQIKHLPVEGIVLNQIESHIPRWLRSLL